MGILITKLDFVGKYNLAKNINDNIDAIIDNYEEQYLIDMLGFDLYELFKLDLVNKIPQAAIYLDIYNKFTVNIDNIVISSKGMKDMLLNLIFFEYSRFNKIKNTTSGQVVNQVEVSVPASNVPLFTYYNNGVKSYKAIQSFVYNDNVNYPLFEGINKKYSAPF